MVWAWERPEDLRFLPGGVEIAALSGFITLRGEGLVARGRRFRLRAPPGRVSTSVVHVQIDHATPLHWTPDLRDRTAAAILALAQHLPAGRIQVDFEVRASEQAVLLDLLAEVRRGLPPGVKLSMTALASWCQTEAWVAQAPVDEIVPMAFRMGKPGAAVRDLLASGGDFRQPACRKALAISTDSPLARAPVGRRVYLFDPRSWDRAEFERIEQEVAAWREPDGPDPSPRP